MTVTTAEEILTAAIKDWRQTGWTQGASIDAKGRRCLVGGIQYASCVNFKYSVTERDKALAAVAEVISGALPHLTVGEKCVEWNDEHGRTVEEVITAAEQARANLKRDADQ